MLHDFPFTVDIIELRNDLKLRTSWETTLYRWKNSFFRSQSASVKGIYFYHSLPRIKHALALKRGKKTSMPQRHVN